MMHRWGKRMAGALACLGLAAGLNAVRAEPAAAASAADVIKACRTAIGTVPQVGERTCRSVQQLVQGSANGCRNLGLAETCATLDGRHTGAAHMTAYEKGWTHRALTLQRGLNDNVPLARATIPHTHNSDNSSVYAPPTLTNLDPNQIYSITDQLRMDIRAIELDLHWVPSLYGSAKTGFKAVTLCHGNVNS